MLILLLLFTPSAFGTVHTWSVTIMELVTLLIVVLAVIRNTFQPAGFQWPKIPFNILVCLFMGYLFLQMTPLPTDWIKIFSPETVKVYERLGLNFESLPEKALRTISLYPHESKVSLLKFLTYSAIFYYVVTFIRTRKEISQIIIVIMLVGFLESLNVLYEYISRSHYIFGWKNKFLAGYPRNSGTYINPAHLSGYLEMVIFLTIGYILSFGSKKMRSGLSGKRSFRQAIVDLWQKEQKLNKQMLLIYPVIFMAVGLFLTGSRGGLVALLGGGVIFFLAALFKKKFRFGAVVVLVLIGVSIPVGLSLKSDNLRAITVRYQTLIHSDPESEARMEIYKSVIPFIKDFFITGSGFGTFENVYPRYQTEELENLHIQKVHNDWLELMTETGVIGAALVLGIVFTYGFLCFKLWGARKDPYPVGIGLGVVGSVAAIFTHSLFDFNLQVSANALLLSVILGIGFVTLHIENGRGVENNHVKFRIIKTTLARRLAICGILAVVSFFWGKQVVYRYLNEFKCPSEINSVMKLNPDPSILEMKEALNYEPKNSDCLVRLASEYQKNKKREPLRFFGKIFSQKMIETYQQAIQLNPAKGENYFLLGREYFFKSFLDQSNSADLMDKGILAFQNAVHYKPLYFKKINKVAIRLLEYTHGTSTLGLLYNGTQWAEGKRGRALRFDALNDYFEISHSDKYLIDQGTVAFWFNAESVAVKQGLFSKDAADRGYGHFTVFINNDSTLGTLFQETPSRTHTLRSDKIEANTWNHVAVTFGPGGMELFLNCKKVSTNRYSGGWAATPTRAANREPILLGVAGWGRRVRSAEPRWNRFEGRMDDLRIYKTRLAGPGIQRIAPCGVPVEEPNSLDDKNLIGYWKFDDDSGTIAEDFSHKAQPGKEIDLHSEKAFELLKRTVEERPETWKDAMKIAYYYYPDPGIVNKFLPQPGKSEEWRKIHFQAGKWLKTHKK